MFLVLLPSLLRSRGGLMSWGIIWVEMMLLVLLSDLVRLREPISGYLCQQRVVHIALSNQYPDIRVRRGLST